MIEMREEMPYVFGLICGWCGRADLVQVLDDWLGDQPKLAEHIARKLREMADRVERRE
jgi:hypothetical protein